MELAVTRDESATLDVEVWLTFVIVVIVSGRKLKTRRGTVRRTELPTLKADCDRTILPSEALEGRTIELAQSVNMNNDNSAVLKRPINERLGSCFFEEKSFWGNM